MKTLILILAILCLASIAVAQTPAYFSQYVEGSSYNKAIEIYNATNQSLDLSRLTIELYSNGSATPGNTYNTTGTLAAGDVWVICHSSAAQAIIDVADELNSGIANFNGNDALVLYFDGIIVDSLGQVGTSDVWGANATLTRKIDSCTGDVIVDDAFTAATLFDVSASDTFTGLGSHTTNCQTVANETLNFGTVKGMYK